MKTNTVVNINLTLVGVLLMCVVLSGCAGLDVTYQFHANYKSKELIEKEQAAADRVREDKLRYEASKVQ